MMLATIFPHPISECLTYAFSSLLEGGSVHDTRNHIFTFRVSHFSMMTTEQHTQIARSVRTPRGEEEVHLTVRLHKTFAV
nr:hypothetical protein Iba_chr15dCG1560 [Ipomoea batatas]